MRFNSSPADNFIRMDSKSGPLLATVTALAMSAPAQELVNQDTTFISGGKQIGVSVFKPRSTAKLPAILVLHGAGGVDVANAYVRQIANIVAASGYATYLVEYFDRTGTRYADDQTMHTNAEKWLSTLNDAVSFIEAQPDVDPKRIGVFGYSLGGYLAVAQSSRDPRIKVVVELAGGVEPTFAKEVDHLPPTLIIHGKDDRRVPFERATELQALLKRLGSHVETLFLANEQHILTPSAAFQAVAQALRFFTDQLR